jgi:hypothetical protein
MMNIYRKGYQQRSLNDFDEGRSSFVYCKRPSFVDANYSGMKWQRDTFPSSINSRNKRQRPTTEFQFDGESPYHYNKKFKLDNERDTIFYNRPPSPRQIRTDDCHSKTPFQEQRKREILLVHPASENEIKLVTARKEADLNYERHQEDHLKLKCHQSSPIRSSLPVKAVSNLSSKEIKLSNIRQSLTHLSDELERLNQEILTRCQIVNDIKIAANVELSGKENQKSYATSMSSDVYYQPQQKSVDQQPDDDIDDFVLQIDAGADYLQSTADVEELFQRTGLNYIFEPTD